MVSFLLDNQQKLLQEWRFSGYVDYQDFVDLAQACNVSQLDLAQDNLLLLVICTVAYELQQDLPQVLPQLIASKIVWYPNYFTSDLIRQGDCGKFLVDPAIAIKYFLVRQQIAQIDLYNRDPNQQLYCAIVKHYHTFLYLQLN